MRRLLLTCSLLLVAAGASAGLDDPQTGEPIPAPSAALAPPHDAPLAPTGREQLTLLAHIADGSTKEVRALGGGYVAFQNGAWLEFYDVSDPFEPTPAARLLLEAQPSDMLVDGSTLYVALRKTEGLLVVDVSDPGAPAVAGQIEGYDLLSVDVEAGVAYCGRGTPGVTVLDVDDLSVIGTFDTPGSANGTDVVGATLFVAQGASGLGIYDVADPGAVTPIGSYPTPSFCTYVMVRDDVAYLAGNFGLMIVNVANPASPTPLGSYNPGDTTYELTLLGDELYLAGLSGGYRLDVADPTNPVALAAFEPASGFSIAVEGGAALLAERFVGLRVLTADNLEALALVPNAGFSNKLHLDGPYLHVADLGGGVRIWDLTDPSAPAYVSDTPTPPNTQDLAVAGGVSFMVNSNDAGDGLWSLDVAVPQMPVVLDTHDTGGAAMGLDVQGDRVYVANGFGGLLVVDAADPAQLQTLGGLSLGANTFDVKVADQVAFVALFGGGLASVDVAQPLSMSVLDQEAWGFLNALDLTGDIAWVADGGLPGLRVVDISDPANLVTIGTGNTPGQARDVVHNGDVFIADDFYGLRQLDVSDPTLPVLTASFPSADRGMGVDSAGDLVVLAGGETGVYVYRIGDPLLATPDAAPRALGLAAAPNPFNPQLEIRWSLPAAADVRVAVFDARGRQVRALDLGSRPAGEGRATWNGADDAGRPCASGTYVLRLQAGERGEQRRVTLVR